MIPCEVCGTPHDENRWRGRITRTCSMSCRSFLMWRTSRNNEQVRPDRVRTCATCEMPYTLSAQQACDEKGGRHVSRYCSMKCSYAARTVWADKREKARKKKRRERAHRRARGLSCTGKPYKSEAVRLRMARFIVPPTRHPAYLG